MRRLMPAVLVTLALAAGACVERGVAEFKRPGDLPPGKPGLFSGKDGEFVLYRKGEVVSSDPTKPSKVRR